jgi:hypothetical protein
LLAGRVCFDTCRPLAATLIKTATSGAAHVPVLGISQGTLRASLNEYMPLCRNIRPSSFGLAIVAAWGLSACRNPDNTAGPLAFVRGGAMREGSTQRATI